MATARFRLNDIIEILKDVRGPGQGSVAAWSSSKDQRAAFGGPKGSRASSQSRAPAVAGSLTRDDGLRANAKLASMYAHFDFLADDESRGLFGEFLYFQLLQNECEAPTPPREQN